MKTIDVISQSNNHTAANLGLLDNLADYIYRREGGGVELSGKVFTSQALQMTGSEISFQSLPPGAGIPFFHQHGQNEEVYVFLKGKGLFQVDDTSFEVGEGSLVRIAPEGVRCWKNIADEPLVFMVLQTKAHSLERFGIIDGELSQGAAWKA